VGGIVEEDGRCAACGQLNRQLARFCRSCGSPIEASSRHAPTERRPVSSAESAPANSASRTSAAHAGNRVPAAAESVPATVRGSALRRRRVAVPLVAVAIAGLLALAGWQTGWPSAVFGIKQVSSTARVRIKPAFRSRAPSAPGTPSPSTQAPSTQAPSTQASSSSAASPTASPSSPESSATPSVSGPAATVKAYFAAIDSRDYATAWRLGGSNLGGSYAAYAQGFAGTASDQVSIISVHGHVVTARLTARQADGSIRIYQGTYAVVGGVITQFAVKRIS
jgi:hypothetical protein